MKRPCFKKEAGVSASVKEEEMSTYQSDVLQGLHEGYDPNDIYNAEKLSPDKKHTLKDDGSHGGKILKEMIIILKETAAIQLDASITGTAKCKHVVIGKSLKLRFFNCKMHLP